MTLFVVCGKANFTNLSRYGDYSERTYRRQYRHPVRFMAFHAATIAAAIPASRDPIAAMDCSFIRKSGSATWGYDYFYNGSAGKAEKGLEIAVIAVVDVAAHQGYTLSVQQTAKTERPDQPAVTRKGKGKGKGKVTLVIISARMQGYIVQLATARPHRPQNPKSPVALPENTTAKSIVAIYPDLNWSPSPIPTSNSTAKWSGISHSNAKSASSI